MASSIFPITTIRQDFPILHKPVHGKPLIYLDNAATTQKPKKVIEALVAFYEQSNANIHRGVHALSECSTQKYEAAREKVRAWVHAKSTDEIIFTKGTTEALNLVAESWARPQLHKGDEILLTEMEHHSNIVPWQFVCQKTGAVLKVVPVNNQGELVWEEFLKRLGRRTKIVAVTHVSNTLGTVNPIASIVKKAKEVGAVVVVDGAQAVAHIPVDVQTLGCDFYAFSGHKMYGPTGIGVLYGKAEHLERMEPYQGGGDMIRSVTFDKTEYAPPPFKFEAGTPPISGAVALGAAMETLSQIGLEAIASHEHSLLDYATQKLREEKGLSIIGQAKEKGGIISFVCEGVHPHDIGTLLDEEGIAIRAGHHCTMPLMKRLGVPGTARISFALYNTKEEIDALVEGLHKVRKVFSIPS
ncbi:MAG: cysteine desulfurase [Gammaproteobacteria bacterium]|nr:cysteine desulfurase [Gammaproteobacteria bacterium]